jgi:hypothetical protein
MSLIIEILTSEKLIFSVLKNSQLLLSNKLTLLVVIFFVSSKDILSLQLLLFLNKSNCSDICVFSFGKSFSKALDCIK